MNSIFFGIAIFGLLSLFFLVQSFFQCTSEKNSFGLVPKVCNIYGSFVWADHLMFGLFWFLVSLITILLRDFLLFLLIFSVFWLIRSVGETVYWFLQQFAPRAGNQPQQYWISRYVQHDAAWFMHQIFWQCISTLTVISSIYLAYLWLHSLT